MDLQEILSEIGDEKAAVITAVIEAEKKKGVDASKKKGADNTKLIAEIARLKDAVKEAAGIEDLGEDPVEMIKQTITGFKAAKQTNNTDSDVAKTLEASFKKQIAELKKGFEDQLANEKKEAEAAKAKYRNTKIAEKLAKEMSGKFSGHDVQIENWILKGKVKLDDSDNVVFIGESDEDLIDHKKYLETFAKERSDLLITQQTPGGGSSGQRVDPKKVKQVSMDQFAKMKLLVETL
jgi:hypothetical protein